jgi:small GTP-binding protein
MNCPNCDVAYNKKNRKPIKLPCDHSFCFKCIYKMKKQPEFLCPIDKKSFDKFFSYPINERIMDNIENDSIHVEREEFERNSLDSSEVGEEKVENNFTRKESNLRKSSFYEEFELEKKIQEDKIKEMTIEIIDKEIAKITDNYDFNFKLITIGNTYTGKTSLLSRYFKNIFEKTSPTITVDFFTKTLKIDDKNVLFTAYDTAGSESYMSMTSKYVRSKHCILFVFDLSKRETFLDIEKWFKFAEELKKEDTLCVLVGNKSDVEEQEVHSREALDFAKRLKMAYFEVSSKNSENVDKLFKYCAIRCYRRFYEESKKPKVEEFRVFNKKPVKKNCFDWLVKIFRG